MKRRAIRDAEIFEFFSKCGFIIMLVSDPEAHHHIIVASILRRHAKAKQDADTRVDRLKLNQVNQALTTIDSSKIQFPAFRKEK